MPASNFPKGFRDGVTVLGLPHQPLVDPDSRILWVDTNAAINGSGSYRRPFKVVQDAIDDAVTGDTILIAAGHTENLSSAEIFAVATAGLTIIGMGEGLRMPTFSSTIAAGAVMITAANTTLKNLKFVANVTDTVQAIDLDANADGTRISGCVFRDTAANKDFLKHIDIATTVTDVIIEDCDFTTYAGGMTESVNFAGTSSYCIIRNNFWHVDCSAGVIDHLADDPLDIAVYGNRIINIDATAGLVLGLDSSGDGTGSVYDNYCLSPKTDAEVIAVTTDYFLAENYASNTINTSGVLNPGADTITT